MTAEHRLLLDVGEVLAIRVECSKCSAAVVIKPSEWHDAPLECPGCGNMWDVPHISPETPSPLQHLGIGLKLLLQHTQTEPTKLRTANGPRFPYRVKIELKEQP